MNVFFHNSCVVNSTAEILTECVAFHSSCVVNNTAEILTECVVFYSWSAAGCHCDWDSAGCHCTRCWHRHTGVLLLQETDKDRLQRLQQWCGSEPVSVEVQHATGETGPGVATPRPRGRGTRHDLGRCHTTPRDEQDSPGSHCTEHCK